MLSVYSDMVIRFGDKDDGVIGVPCITRDDHQIPLVDRVVEAGYFYGKAKKKNIIVISTQKKCPMKCKFCELGAEKFGGDLNFFEMRDQVMLVLREAEREGFTLSNYPHKITFANSGEPLLNRRIVPAVYDLAALFKTSFKLSTILPASSSAYHSVADLARFANTYDKSFQLQISLISTSEEERQEKAGVRVANFAEIREVGEIWRGFNPCGRRINLSIIATSKMDSDVSKVFKILPPQLFCIRIREYVETENGRNNGLRMISADRLAEVKERFSDRGYTVLHFASPTDTERKFGLASNAIRKIYLDCIK